MKFNKINNNIMCSLKDIESHDNNHKNVDILTDDYINIIKLMKMNI
jgi:hypothetical protein